MSDFLRELLYRRRVVTSAGCWEWTAGISTAGYGRIRVLGKELYAHRVSYEAHVGPIPAGLVIDHLCRNRACFNPAHLEPVTQRENIRRGTSPWALAGALNQCAKGHEFTPANTYLRPDGLGRHCRQCIQVRSAARKRLPRWTCPECGAELAGWSRPGHLKRRHTDKERAS